jgi:hypothetical protein
MAAKLCKSMDDVIDFYYYKNGRVPIPEKFPCVMVEIDNQGGITGQYYTYEFKYVPHYPPYLAHVYAEGYLQGVYDALR